jgi:uncharacterized protein (TIGR04141 family)
MARSPTPLQSLAIYKLRGCRRPEDALRSRARLKRLELPGIGTLFIRPVRSRPPRWASFFAGQVDAEEFGRGTTPGAALLATVDDEHFAVTFGAGRFLLDPSRTELSFGLDVAKNLVGAKRLRSVDKQRLDRVGTASRVQTAREATPSDFSIEYDRELLRSIAGAPEDGQPGESVAGLDVLRMSARLQISQLTQLLRRLSRHATATRYRRTFPGMDQIAPVRDPAEIDKLDTALCDRLLARDTEHITLSTPDIVDWSDVSAFRFGSRKSLEYPELRLDTLLDLLEARRANPRQALDRTRISVLRSDDTVANAWSAYRCLYAEIVRGARVYLLSGGRWYSVASSFVAEVDDAMSRIDVIATDLPPYTHDDEGAYNAAAAGLTHLRLVLTDRKLVRCRAAASGVEFCDLYSADRDIIHVKRAGGSSVYSHWFSQATTSALLLKHEPEFRQKLTCILPASHAIAASGTHFDATGYRIILALIGGPPSPATLPFFSKITLRSSHRDLTGLGYGFAFTTIPVPEDHARRVRVRPKTRGR